MPKPLNGSGRSTAWREDLNTFRRLEDRVQFAARVLQVKQLYALLGSVGATSRPLGIGKRTLERAMVEVPELGAAIDDVRTGAGR
jgi:hypothetical protein